MELARDHTTTLAGKSLKAAPRSDTDSGYSSGDASEASVGVDPTPSTADVAAQLAVAQPTTKTWREVLEPRMWSSIVIAVLWSSAPLLIGVTLTLVALRALFGAREKAVPFNGKVAIVSGGKMTKSFVIMKHLKAQGCRVVLVETHKYWMVASRFSKCVDRFVTVPVPEKDPEAYLAAMKQIAAEEKADLFVPVTSPVASAFEARVASVLPAGCHSWSLSPESVEELDDKVIFCNTAEALGLSIPTAHRVCGHKEVHDFNQKLAERDASVKQPRFILKNLQYDSMHRLDLFTLPCPTAKLQAYLDEIVIDEANPWTLQTFIVGEEYSTCGFVKAGKLCAFTDNAASISCFNYKPARSTQLRQWVETFCAAKKLSGIVCIDFIVEADGTPYAIECNPRASSNLANFYNHEGLGAVLVHPEAYATTIEPLADVVETYWLFSEVWAALTKPGLTLGTAASRAYALLDTVIHKKDAYFDYHDPLPFLALLCVHIPILLLRNLSTGNKWAKIDPCIGKLTEENGD